MENNNNILTLLSCTFLRSCYNRESLMIIYGFNVHEIETQHPNKN